jgi:hypothetical protein
MTYYWTLRKDFLDYIEDSTSHDSLIESTISTRSKKNVSCASKISFPSVLSHDTKTPKLSEKDSLHDFYPKSFNHAFFSKLTLRDTGTLLRRNLKREPENPSIFMKMIKGITRIVSAVHYERRQVLPSKVI